MKEVTQGAGFCAGVRISRYDEDTVKLILQHLPEGTFRRIVIKPNWVKHESSPDFPIQALVTDSRLLVAIVRACVERYPGAEEIKVADAPLQGCDWEALLSQAGLERLITSHGVGYKPRVTIHDLRESRVSLAEGRIERREQDLEGDPNGYRDVVLDNTSFLEEISDSGPRFRVADYEPRETISNHRKGFHRYRIAGSILDADLLINVPKMKCHQKAGVTGALKNLVGINGNKANLVHYRQGLSSRTGDEFPPRASWAVVAQVRVRKVVQHAPRWLYRVLRQGWRVIRRVRGIEVQGTRDRIGKRFFVSGGSWYGNDTIWRMIYDLNRIALYSPSEGGGVLSTPQRRYLAILDGVVAGEGNGPLQPLAVSANLLMFADNPFLMDMAMATLMGFDWRKIPSLENYVKFPGAWARFDPETVTVTLDGRPFHGVGALPTLHTFLPPPGWRGHIERMSPLSREPELPPRGSQG